MADASSEKDDTEETIEHWQKLVSKAKALAKDGHVRKAIEITKEALAIHHSEKLELRLKKMEDYLKAYGDASDSEEENADTMIHMGNGYYLYKDLHSQLYSHQKEGVLWMWSLFQKKKGGILGDDMGLGKTIQVIAFLAGLFDLEKIHNVLIVLPTVVLVNWEREFQKWAPGIRLELYHGGSKNERQRTLEKVHRRGGVVLTTYGMVVSSYEQLAKHDGKMIKWDYVILDEGHKIKNPSNKSSKGLHYIQAKNRLLLSGTPLMNNLKELWALFDWAHHGALLGTSTTFHMQYGDPITRARQKGATAGEQRLGQKMSESLKDIIAPYFLRRLKKEVEKREQEDKENLAPGKERDSKAMPSLTRKNDLVIWVYLSKIQQEIYQGFVDSEDVREILNSTRSPLTALVQLKKICDHPRLLTVNQCRQLGLRLSEGNLNENQNDESAAMSIDYIDDHELVEESGKMVFLIELLNNLRSEGHRTLVFSQSRKILDIIQKVLRNSGHKVARIDGTIKNFYEREEVIKKFSIDKSYTVFLLTTQVGGVGLTITAADRVVIFDPSWNPATDAQAIDRAFRIGQDKNVVVYRLITCGSIEEKIYRRQVFKDSIFRLATGSNDNPYRYFSSYELAELFKLDNPRESETQQQLVKLHSASQRKTDTSLDAHIAYLHTLAMYGVSDHDLMFSTDSVDDNTDAHEEDFIDQRVHKARTLIAMDNQSNMLVAETLGHYPGAGNVEKKQERPISGPSMGWNFPGRSHDDDDSNSVMSDDGNGYDDRSFENHDHINVKKVLEASMNLLQLEEEGNNNSRQESDSEEEELKPYDACATAGASDHSYSETNGGFTNSPRYDTKVSAPVYEDKLPDLRAPARFLKRGLETATSSSVYPNNDSLVVLSDEEEEDNFYDARKSIAPENGNGPEMGNAPEIGSELEIASGDDSIILEESGDENSFRHMKDLSNPTYLQESAVQMDEMQYSKSPSAMSPYRSPSKVGAKSGQDRRRSVAHTPMSPGPLSRKHSPPVVLEELVFSPRRAEPEIKLDKAPNSAKRSFCGFEDATEYAAEYDDDSPIGTTKKLRPMNYIASDDSVDSVRSAYDSANEDEPEKVQLNFDSTVNTSEKTADADHSTHSSHKAADVSQVPSSVSDAADDDVVANDEDDAITAAEAGDDGVDFDTSDMQTDSNQDEEVLNGLDAKGGKHEEMEEDNEAEEAKGEDEVEEDEGVVGDNEDDGDDDDEEEEEEDEEELTEEEEAEYIKLLTQSKELYKQGDLINALQYALDALEIYNGDERARKFTLKLQAKLKLAGTIS